MKLITKSLSLLLVLALLLMGLAACSKKPDGENETTPPTETTTGDDSKETLPPPDTDLEINLMFLNGTTALGAAELIAKGEKNEMNYDIEVVADPTIITGSIVSGECDIAALPTNVAAKLYKASSGKVKLLAVNTLGVLYLLSNGEEIADVESLRGKTVYLPGGGSNPEYITEALLGAYGLTEDDVTLDTTRYPNPDALTTALASGAVSLAVLPEPKVTVVTSKNANIKVSLNFTELWEEKFGENTLAQGCLVVNAKFAEEHPSEVNRFLDDYKKSLETVMKGDDNAISLILEAGLLPSEGVAKKALPNCNITFIEGKDMKDTIEVFFQTIYAVDPQSILTVPDDDFYYAR